MRNANPTEQQIHQTLVDLIRVRNPHLLFWHTPNGGKRHIIEAAKFQRMGVLPGVSDLVFLHNGKFFALELKKRGNRPTEHQENFMERVKDALGYAFWVDGVDEGEAVLASWGVI